MCRVLVLASAGEMGTRQHRHDVVGGGRRQPQAAAGGSCSCASCGPTLTTGCWQRRAGRITHRAWLEGCALGAADTVLLTFARTPQFSSQPRCLESAAGVACSTCIVCAIHRRSACCRCRPSPLPSITNPTLHKLHASRTRSVPRKLMLNWVCTGKNGNSQQKADALQGGKAGSSAPGGSSGGRCSRHLAPLLRSLAPRLQLLLLHRLLQREPAAAGGLGGKL